MNPKTPSPSPPLSWATRLRYFLVGPPRNLEDRSVYHRLSLVAFLAWVGLGADGLSSSAYGPEDAFRQLGSHGYLAIGLAVLMAGTVLIISVAYSRIIEQFPHGGGGYVVATRLLGEGAGVVSGSSLLVDYVLTITVSIAASGDAFFSLVAPSAAAWKLPVEVALLLLLLVLNLRGVKESVVALTPIFLLFVVTHAILIYFGIIVQSDRIPQVMSEARAGFSNGLSTVGLGGLAMVFIRAFSLGGGTYTGIEAVSNGLAIMREPRVKTAKRTMLYMGLSLALTASGLLFCYLLWNVSPVEGKTMNAVLTERFAGNSNLGKAFVILTLVSEGALLVVAAQAGFVDGPRVLANMAVDSWVPRRFAALSDRLTMQNGTLLMGLTALAALVLTHGSVDALVIMYSINVFVTFSLSMLAMLKHSLRSGLRRAERARQIALFGTGLALCVTILGITVFEKFRQGGWITLVVTSGVIALCFLIRRHYDAVTRRLTALYQQLTLVPETPGAKPSPPDPEKPVAAILVSGFGGLGLHTYLSVFRDFPNHFKGVVFVSVGVVDSKEFKGEDTVDALKSSVEGQLARYAAHAAGQGMPAATRMAVGTDAVAEGEALCLSVAKEFPHATFFAGKVLFQKEKWYQGILHNETAFALQRRLQWAGRTVVIVPARLP